MPHQNKALSALLEGLDLGSSVAEEDTLLETARIETSAFTDLMSDRVDLVPGTKGSGKSALFRIFVDFLPARLLRERKVVVAHGVHAPGDPIFHAFTDWFEKLSEEQFVSFWCVYLVSLAHEQFIKESRYHELLKDASVQIERFRKACAKAKIPEIQAKKSLKEILEWSLHVLTSLHPKLKFLPPGGVGEFELDLFGSDVDSHPEETRDESDHSLPEYVNDIKQALEAVLETSRLSLWLMVDRLDEIFPRRSEVERKALRGLLRAMRYFASPNIRVKVFLRDDMLEQVVNDPHGFTALTHVTARQADTLRWTEDQILAMVVKRFCANDVLATYLQVNLDKLGASANYRVQCFDKIFPATVFRGPKQSPTVRWIYNRCADGRGVVTPRDVIDLLIRAQQKQQDICAADQEGRSDDIISAAAIQYGFEELSTRKRVTYLQAEFPHLWKDMERFTGGKTDYNAATLQSLLGRNWKTIAEDLLAIGFLSKTEKAEKAAYSIPFLYRHGLKLIQGRA
jgi:hypothetical protein